MCVCEVTNGSCDSPSTSYVHKTMLVWITWPTSGPGPQQTPSRGWNIIILLAKCYFSSSPEDLSVCRASPGTPAGRGRRIMGAQFRINVRWVISYRKVHLTDVQMALWSGGFSSGAQRRVNPFPPLSTPNMWKQNTENQRGDAPSSVSGGHTVTFSYVLMAEIVSSLQEVYRRHARKTTKNISIR